MTGDEPSEFERFLGLEFSDLSIVAVWLASFAVAKVLIGSGRRHDRGRAHLAGIARTWHPRLQGYYQSGVRWLLSLIDKASRDGFLVRADDTAAHELRPLRAPVPWTPGLYDLALRLALVYPMAFAILNWAASGVSMPGFEEVLPPTANHLLRLFAFIAVCMVFYFSIKYFQTEGWRSLLYAGLAFGIAVAVAGAVAFAGGVAFTVAFAGAGAFAVAGCAAWPCPDPYARGSGAGLRCDQGRRRSMARLLGSGLLCCNLALKLAIPEIANMGSGLRCCNSTLKPAILEIATSQA